MTYYIMQSIHPYYRRHLRETVRQQVLCVARLQKIYGRVADELCYQVQNDACEKTSRRDKFIRQRNFAQMRVFRYDKLFQELQKQRKNDAARIQRVQKETQINLKDYKIEYKKRINRRKRLRLSAVYIIIRMNVGFTAALSRRRTDCKKGHKHLT